MLSTPLAPQRKPDDQANDRQKRSNQEASLPDVDVNVEGGNMPEYETAVGDVDFGTEKVTVTVPTVYLEPPEVAS